MAGPVELPGAVPYKPMGEEYEGQSLLPKKWQEPGKAVRPAPPDKGAHWWDEIKYEVFQDFEDDVAWVKEALVEGTRAPFSANVSEDQKLEYFRSKLFLPNGAKNDSGRTELLRMFGARGLANIMAEVFDKQARPMIVEPKDFYLQNPDAPERPDEG